MTAVAIIKDGTTANTQALYRAVAQPGNRQATGRTAGEALDALTALFSEADAGLLFIAPSAQPDVYFDAAQIERLQELTQRAQSSPASLTPEEEAERHKLIKAELLASAQRIGDLADALGR